jgi:hypothetical protein
MIRRRLAPPKNDYTKRDFPLKQSSPSSFLGEVLLCQSSKSCSISLYPLPKSKTLQPLYNRQKLNPEPNNRIMIGKYRLWQDVYHRIIWTMLIFSNGPLFVRSVGLRLLLCKEIPSIHIEHLYFIASTGIEKSFEIASAVAASKRERKTQTGNPNTRCLKLMWKRCEEFVPSADRLIS